MEQFFKLSKAIISGLPSSSEKYFMNRRFICSVILCLFITPALPQDLVSQTAADRLFATGMDLMEHHEFGGARQSFSQFLVKADFSDRRRAEATYYHAFCALNLYHADGEKMIEDFVSIYSDHPKTATAYFDLANFFYNEKNYGRASANFKKVDFTALSNEQHSVGRFHWGYSLFNLRKLDEALDQFNFIKNLGGQYGPASSYYAGFLEMENGDYSNAIIDLKRAEQNNSYALVVPYLIANVYYRQGRYDDLLAYVTSLDNKEGVANEEEIALLAAEAYYNKRDYKNALTGYQTYLAVNKSRADRGVMLRAGFCAYTLDNVDAALSYLKGSASDKDSVGFYSSYYLGSIYLKQNQKQLALTAFDNAKKFKADPKLVEESSFQAAKILYDLGRPDQSIEELESFLETYATSSHLTEVKELLSQAYVNANNYNKAIEYIEALPARNPAIVKAYQKATLLKGMELFNMEQYGEAVVMFEKSIQNPVDQNYTAEASFWSGEAYSIGRKYEQAADHYLRVIGLPNYFNNEIITKTRYGLGYAYFNQQQYDRALFSFKEFAKSAPGNPNLADGTLRLADCYYVTKVYPEALSNYRKAIQLKSADSDYAHMQAGVILGIQRKYAEAATELNQVLTNYPKSRFIDEAMFQRAQLDFEQGNYTAAASGYSKLIASNKSSRFTPYAYMRRAASYYNLKDYNKTASDYMTVVDDYAAHPVANDALLPLQEALNLAGRGAEFDAHLAHFKQANPDAKGIEAVEFETAKNLYFSQEYQRAIQSLGSYIISYPESPGLTEAKYYLAESHYRMKENSKALAIHREISTDAGFLFASRVTSRIAELEFKLGNYNQAIPVFQQLARIATTKKDQYSAWSGLMETYYMLANYDSVDAYARLIIEKGNVSAGAQNKAALFLGKSAMGRGDYETAKDEFLNTLNTARDENGAEAKYLLAEIFYLTKEHKQCYETLVGLNTDFAAYTEWVGKSYLLLSDNFVAMGDLFQAKGTLNSLVENFPLENIKSLAREKLKKIQDAELKKEQELKKTDSLNRNN